MEIDGFDDFAGLCRLIRSTIGGIAGCGVVGRCGTGNSAGGRIIGRRRDRLLRRGVIGVSKRLEIVRLSLIMLSFRS